MGSATAMGLAFLVLVLDIASKEWILALFPLHEAKAVSSFFNIGHWLNPGAAFSFLSNAGGWQRYFFSAIAFIAVGWLSYSLWFNRNLTGPIRAAYALIAGGAAGNLYDRLARGAVVDWLDFHWEGWHWPAFNLADCAIVLGLILYIISQRKEGPTSAPAKTDHANF